MELGVALGSLGWCGAQPRLSTKKRCFLRRLLLRHALVSVVVLPEARASDADGPCCSRKETHSRQDVWPHLQLAVAHVVCGLGQLAEEGGHCGRGTEAAVSKRKGGRRGGCTRFCSPMPLTHRGTGARSPQQFSHNERSSEAHGSTPPQHRPTCSQHRASHAVKLGARVGVDGARANAQRHAPQHLLGSQLQQLPAPPSAVLAALGAALLHHRPAAIRHEERDYRRGQGGGGGGGPFRTQLVPASRRNRRSSARAQRSRCVGPVQGTALGRGKRTHVS